jgi:hypothetical protein
MHRECIEYGGCFNMPLLHIRVSTRSRERGQGHYSTYFFQMYIILIPEKEKKRFSLFHFFLSNGWLTVHVYQFYWFVQNIYMTESFH